MSNALGIPDEFLGLLTAQDERMGFPPGTMAAIFQTEVGGDFQKYLDNPATYHYAANAQGQRIAPHSGEVSTAFGPFGFLESTVKDPGWGVKPLQDKTSLEEHVRFAADYLAARIKQTGSFEKGIGAYGEGDKYANKVLAHIPGYAQPQVAMADPPATGQATPEVPEIPVMQAHVALPDTQPQAAAGQEVPAEWEQFRNWIPRRDEPAGVDRRPKQLAAGVRAPDFSESLGMANAMMARNQTTLQQGWDAMQGWA